MKVLIADDDRMSTLMLGRTLESWTFDVTVVHDGNAAWEHLASLTEPSLAIVDWMMPGLSGVELCRRVRASRLPAAAYIVLLTARTERQDLIAGLEAGADDYLTKPFDPDELRARLHVGQRTLDYIASIKRLSGLLPICSYCKNVRSDQDYWQQVESYISEHTDVMFSHGICPTCLDRVLADLGREEASGDSR